MDNIAYIVLGLVCVVVAIALVGGLIGWALGMHRRRLVYLCPQCGRVLADRGMMCPDCRSAGDAAAARRAADRLLYARKITPELHTAFVAALTPGAAAPHQAPVAAPPEAVPADAALAARLRDAQMRRQQAVAAPVDSTATPIAPVTPVAPPPLGPIALQYESEPIVSAPEPYVPEPIILRQPARPQPPAAPPRAPRQPFKQMLARFMEEKNIRWGELMGGLLIIGCSLALVISFWAEISQKQWLKFILFNGVTATFFGVGLYTEHRWKLPTTSRGVLLIATLLVPLNFLAISAFSSHAAADAWLPVAGEGLSIVVFFVLVQLAARVLMPAAAWLLPIAVIAASGMQPLIRWIGQPGVAWEALVVLAAIPLAAYLAANLRLVRQTQRNGVDLAGAHRLLMLLGLSSFATLISLGFLIEKSGRVLWALHCLAPLTCLLAAPAMAVGLLLWKKLSATERAHAAPRLTGTTLAIVGALVMLTGLGLAWPNPLSVVVCGLLVFGLLAFISVRAEVPAGYLPADAVLTLAVLVGYHALRGHVSWADDAAPLMMWLGAARTGQVMVTLVAAFALCAELFTRLKRPAHGRIHLGFAIGLAIVSLALVTIHGFAGVGAQQAPVWMYAAYAGGTWLLSWSRQSVALAWASMVLLLAALVQLIVPGADVFSCWQGALLGHAACATMIAVCYAIWVPAAKWPVFRQAALITSVGAMLVIVLGLGHVPANVSALNCFWVAVLWMALAVLNRSPGLMTAFEAAATFGAALVAHQRLAGLLWFKVDTKPYMDVWYLQGIALPGGGAALLWLVARVAACRWGRRDLPNAVTPGKPGAIWTGFMSAERLLNPPWPALDQILTLLLLGLAMVFAALAAGPGVRAEISETVIREPHVNHAIGTGSFLVCGLVAVLFVGAMWDRFGRGALIGLLWVAACVTALLAAPSEDEHAGASALRWYAASFLLVGSVLLWGRTHLGRLLTAARIAPGPRALAAILRTLLLVLTIAPILLLTLFPAAQQLAGTHLAGPIRGSFFARLGPALSYLVPLAAISLMLAGHGLRERHAAYVFFAGLVLNLTVTLGYALAHSTAHLPFDAASVVRMVQYNILTAGLFGLLWMTFRTRLSAVGGARRDSVLLAVQIGVTAALALGLILAGTVRLVVEPEHMTEGMMAVGQVWGWIGTLVAAGLVLWGVRVRRGLQAPGGGVSLAQFGPGDGIAGLGVETGALILLAFVCLLALAVGAFDHGDFVSYHTLVIGATLVAWLPVGGRFATALREGSTGTMPARPTGVTASAMLGLLAAGLTLRGATDDPSPLSWPIGPLFVLAGLAIALAGRSIRRDFLYPAAILLNTAATFWLWRMPLGMDLDFFVNIVRANILVLALPAFGWLVMEVFYFRLREPEFPPMGLPAIHHAAAILSTVGVFALTLFDRDPSTILTVASLGATVALLLACLWDSAARYASALLYLVGLAIVGTALQHVTIPAAIEELVSLLVPVGYTLLTAAIFHLAPRASRLVRALGMALQIDSARRPPVWLMIFHFLLAAPAVGALAIVWSDDLLWRRLVAAAALGVAAWATGLLARGTARRVLQFIALAIAVLAVAWLGWALQGPQVAMLDRQAVLLLGLVLSAAALALGVARQTRSDWSAAAVRLTRPIGGLVAILLLVVLGTEVASHVNTGTVPMDLGSILIVAATLVVAAAACLSLALLPGADPLHLPESQRTAYVYAAEMLLVLTFVHFRLTRPQWFGGILQQYWPMLLVVLAFIGAAAGEVLHRRKRRVLGDPLGNTGAILPIFPMLAFWIAPHSFPLHIDYSLLLLLSAMVYLLRSACRRSFGMAIVSAVVGNAGLWYWLYRQPGYGFLHHPQLWLIPLALSVLAATYFNRQTIPARLLANTRLGCILTIYLSSTADIFLTASLWLPLVLMFLSVGGMLLGILWRIRAFLYLGTVFVLIALVSMVWNAAAHLGWTWLWWVAGICLGVALIVLFGLFEKKRTQMMALVENLKEWQ